MNELLAFVTWLIDEKGPNVNRTEGRLVTPLHIACLPELVGLLLDRGADPGFLYFSLTPLMSYVMGADRACVVRLLEDQGGRATVNMQVQVGCFAGSTALHFVGHKSPYKPGIKECQIQVLELLLEAGADTTILDSKGQTAEAGLHEVMSEDRFLYERPDLLAVFQQIPDSRRAAVLVHARRLVVAASHGLTVTQGPTEGQDELTVAFAALGVDARGSSRGRRRRTGDSRSRSSRKRRRRCCQRCQ
jgi:hypothetical protein